MHDTSRRNFIGSSLALLVASFAGAAGLLKLSPAAKPRAIRQSGTLSQTWGRCEDTEDIEFPSTLTTCDQTVSDWKPLAGGGRYCTVVTHAPRSMTVTDTSTLA